MSIRKGMLIPTGKAPASAAGISRDESRPQVNDACSQRRGGQCLQAQRLQDFTLPRSPGLSNDANRYDDMLIQYPDRLNPIHRQTVPDWSSNGQHQLSPSLVTSCRMRPSQRVFRVKSEKLKEKSVLTARLNPDCGGAPILKG